MRAACVRAAVPAATAGLSPVENLCALTPTPWSSWAADAIPTGPDDDEIENDVDSLDNERPPRKPPPPPALPLPSAMSVAGRGIEGDEVSSEATNAGGERRYRRGANAAVSWNARRHTCQGGGGDERKCGWEIDIIGRALCTVGALDARESGPDYRNTTSLHHDKNTRQQLTGVVYHMACRLRAAQATRGGCVHITFP